MFRYLPAITMRCTVSSSITVLCLLLLSSGCAKKVPDSYQIIAEGLSLPDQTIFLLDTYSSNVVDSTVIKGGHFEFNIAKDKIKSRLMGIQYFDEDRDKKALFRFPFGNSRKSFHNWFFVEDNMTKLAEFEEEDEKGANAGYYARVDKDGYENRLVREYPNLKLSDNVGYDKILADYRKRILEHNDSKFFVGCLFNNRTAFDKSDLKNVFELFSSDAKASFYGRILSAFFDADAPSSFTLASARVGLVQDVDRRAALNILAFRGYVMAPFLQENPYLDSLAHRYAGNELVSFSHISTEKDRLNWKASLQLYRPSWPQFVVDKTSVDFLYFKYNFRGLPLIVFTDEYGRVIRRIEGYKQARLVDYEGIIRENL